MPKTTIVLFLSVFLFSVFCHLFFCSCFFCFFVFLYSFWRVLYFIFIFFPGFYLLYCSEFSFCIFVFYFSFSFLAVFFFKCDLLFSHVTQTTLLTTLSRTRRPLENPDIEGKKIMRLFSPGDGGEGALSTEGWDVPTR